MCVGSRLMARPSEKTPGLLGIKDGMSPGCRLSKVSTCSKDNRSPQPGKWIHSKKRDLRSVALSKRWGKTQLERLKCSVAVQKYFQCCYYVVFPIGATNSEGHVAMPDPFLFDLIRRHSIQIN